LKYVQAPQEYPGGENRQQRLALNSARADAPRTDLFFMGESGMKISRYQKCSCCLNGFKHSGRILRYEMYDVTRGKPGWRFSFRSQGQLGQLIATMTAK
jgi:hypothetical protein